jgi:hypothetical protein
MWRCVANTLFACTLDDNAGGQYFLDARQILARALSDWLEAVEGRQDGPPNEVLIKASELATALRTNVGLYDQMMAHCDKTAQELDAWRLEVYGAAAMAIRHGKVLPADLHTERDRAIELLVEKQDDFGRSLQDGGALDNLDQLFDDAMR